MGIRGHRIEKLEISETRCFLHDDNGYKWLDYNGKLESLSCDGSGIACFDVEELVALIDIVDDEDLKQQIREDIAWAKEKDQDFVEYYFY